jgi:hypothetical protein
MFRIVAFCGLEESASCTNFT